MSAGRGAPTEHDPRELPASAVPPKALSRCVLERGGAGRGSSLKLTEAVAGDFTANSGGSQGGDRRATGFLGVRATRVKRATGGRVDRRGRVTEEDDPLTGSFHLWVRGRDGADEGAGVRVAWTFDHVDGGAQFNDLAEVHHGDAIRDVFYHRQIVGDEDKRQMHLPAELREQIENLRLNGNIQSRNGFVCDDQARLEGERAGDGDPLPLAAGKFVRVFLHKPRGETNQLHELGDAG